MVELLYVPDFIAKHPHEPVQLWPQLYLINKLDCILFTVVLVMCKFDLGTKAAA